MSDNSNMQADIAMVGLGVMGRSLALNMESHGCKVACYNRDPKTLDEFLSGPGLNKRFLPIRDLSEVAVVLKKPRLVFLMVTAGKPVDDLIEQLIPHLEPGDVIIDGGNSFYEDTSRRAQYLESKNLLYIGTGISGGEQGALLGPSIMPGGSPRAWPLVREILQNIAAKTADGTPCCDWIGKEGAGHFVKMVHNGIEYADMQLISEAYFLLKHTLGMTNDEMAAAFQSWNTGELESFLINATADVLSKKDPDTGQAMVDIILDAAHQKGTGKWTAETAFELGIPIPTIDQAVSTRNMSALKTERMVAEKIYAPHPGGYTGDRQDFVDAVRHALFASKLCAYAQGFALMRAASQRYEWELDLGRIALMWREGCIIRARFLDRIAEAFARTPDLANLLLDSFFEEAVDEGLAGWRKVGATALELGYSVPAFTSALAYFDAYICGRGPANLIQAQRDYFGAHTFERVDKPGTFHVEWSKL